MAEEAAVALADGQAAPAEVGEGPCRAVGVIVCVAFCRAGHRGGGSASTQAHAERARPAHHRASTPSDGIETRIRVRTRPAACRPKHRNSHPTGRSSGSRLIDGPRATFPPCGSGLCRCPGAWPITAAAPRRILTVFPILPRDARRHAGGTRRGPDCNAPGGALSTPRPGLMPPACTNLATS
jgi:hypothetical protein